MKAKARTIKKITENFTLIIKITLFRKSCKKAKARSMIFVIVNIPIQEM